jgi:large subunit ribosomal protein L10
VYLVTLKLEGKKQIVAAVADTAKTAVSVVVVDYRGMDVASLTAFRAKARDMGVAVRVVRNTLARRALEGTNHACLSDLLVGPMMLLFGLQEPGTAARLAHDFMGDCEQLEVKALSLDGQLLGAEQLKIVASLPSLDEALAKLMATMLAPVTQLTRTIQEPVAQVVRVTAAIKDR